MARKKILYITDFSYQAKGRRYHEEDLHLTGRLRESFSLLIRDPRDANDHLDAVDGIVLRNAGPVSNFPHQYAEYLRRAHEGRLRTYNSVDGKGDMRGKGYLLELTRAGFPVIPTVETVEGLESLGGSSTASYVVKDKNGADSIGLEFLDYGDAAERLRGRKGEVLAQPRIDFRYEVSFYFVDQEFQYALYAPETSRRWELVSYKASAADLEFARRFVAWNNIRHGIQRVDACRTSDGELLLVELEDLNPFLSLDRLDDEQRGKFIRALTSSIGRAIS